MNYKDFIGERKDCKTIIKKLGYNPKNIISKYVASTLRETRRKPKRIRGYVGVNININDFEEE